MMWNSFINRRTAAALVLASMIAFFPIGMPSAAADEGSMILQLRSFAVTAVSTRGYRGRTDVTAFLVVQNEDAVERACRGAPRIIDALNVAFDENPVELTDGPIDLSGRQQELATVVRDAVGIGVFERLYVRHGDFPEGRAPAASPLAGSTIQCRPIAELPWNRAVVEPAPAVEQQPQVSEEQFAAELESEIANREVSRFPDAPLMPSGPPWSTIMLFLLGMGGLMLIFGSYVGYRVGKIRRDRRRQERRRKERRFRPGVSPTGSERRSGSDRRDGTKNRRTGPRRSGGE